MNTLTNKLTIVEIEFLKLLKSKLKEELKDTFVDLVLFGSKARGDSNKNSDIDLLLVITDKKHIEKADEILFDLQMKYDLYDINMLIYSKSVYNEQLNNSKNIFLGNVKREGIRIWIEKIRYRYQS